MKKKTLQKIAQLTDTLPVGKERTQAFKDYLKLKLTDSKEIILELVKKYKQ